MELQEIYDRLLDQTSQDEMKMLEEDIINKYLQKNQAKEEISDENTATEIPEITAENAEIQEEKEISDEEFSEPEQLTIPEIPKENFFVKLMRKSYERKSKKAKQKIKSAEKMIKSKIAERTQIENAIDNLNEKSRILSGEIIGLINANTFLETNFNGGLVEKFLRLTVHSNNKKIAKLKAEINGLERKCESFCSRIKIIEKEIERLEKTIPNRKKDVEVIKAKTENLTRINEFANPLAGILVNMKNPSLALDLEKNCYKKITQEEFDKLQKAPFDCRYKRNAKVIIVKFPRADLELFNSALGG
jgi:hypothetical protein